jgi:hypothetical protein
MRRGLEEEMRWEAVSPASSWSILPIRADILCFPSKFVEHSYSLPTPEEFYDRNNAAPEAFSEGHTKRIASGIDGFPCCLTGQRSRKTVQCCLEKFCVRAISLLCSFSWLYGLLSSK